ncbi:SMI1/KNR4 family protein [Streptomyces sp. HPF1205]|uniref:SMI1/KNR4 family protein n=1 Tax=Streptomyces sp. HPF1205 TaxID=2873262 RepID=UPI001CEC2206|nr:SMI1/KNR4 family protein [Streptomyces sp. HPF1205]
MVAGLVDRRAATASTPLGLSAQEIDAIARDQAAPVGTAYRCFLELIGGGIGRLLQGSDVFHPEVLGLREAADDLLRENHTTFALGPTDRVILMHQGYCFAFLHGTGPDPEVWSYDEGYHPDVIPFPAAPTFTDWLRTHADQYQRRTHNSVGTHRGKRP